MGQEALLEVEPDALDGVELGRVGRQRHERDVVGHGEIVRAVPSGLVEHHGDVLVIGDCGGETIEEDLHRLGVGVGQNKGEAVIRAGLDRREDVGEGEALVAKAGWSLAAFPPDVACASLLADARLVLEEQAHALTRPSADFTQDRRGSF